MRTGTEFSIERAKQSDWCNSRTILPTVTENGVNGRDLFEL
jgi:hypothetical protein